MMDLFSRDRLLPRLVQGALSLLGLYALARFLPRLFRSMTKRFVVGILGEILIVAATTLLTDRLSRNGQRHASK